MVDLNPGMTFKQAVAISAGNKSIMNIIQVKSFSSLINDAKTEVMKIIVFDRRGRSAFTEIIKEINNMGNLIITSSSASNIEINDSKAQKGLALLDYGTKKGIKRDEIAAIGDNLNDESMIREAGIGVAMGNAIPAIKKIAQVTTKTNNENGVAYILEKFINDNLRSNK